LAQGNSHAGTLPAAGKFQKEKRGAEIAGASSN
jgi:hypothetical protein